MFEPKIYKKNGLEAFRLVGSDGSEFFYEGALDCDEQALFKDQLGRLYYPVIAEIGGAVKYYVELEPQVQTIPLVAQDARSKDIALLVNASPRAEAPLPEDIFVKPEASQDASQEAPQAMSLEPLSVEPVPVEPAPPEKLPEPGAEMPLPATAEHVKSDEAASAIHAVFAPRADIPHPSGEQAGTAAETEAKPEEPAPPERAPVNDPKTRSLKWPLVIGAIVIVLLAAAVGVYLVKPQAYDGIKSMLNGPSPTPSPTPEPTATPSSTPAPTPAPAIQELIDSDSPVVAEFAQACIDANSTGNPLRQTCDLFDAVNDRWTYSSTTYRKASEITATLEGDTRDYTTLMIALMRSVGIECRIVAYDVDGDSDLRYYPEVLVANTSSGYRMVSEQLDSWYGVPSPQGHSDEAGYWIALSMGRIPGVRPSDAMKEFVLP